MGKDTSDQSIILEIFDSHVHFWDPVSTPREVSPLVKLFGFQPSLLHWVAKKVFPANALDFFASPEYLFKPHLPSDMQFEEQSFFIKGVVHVEAGWKGKGKFACVDETKWLTNLHFSGGEPISAIVAHADLSLGTSIREVLVRHKEANKRVCGIRDMLSWHPNPKVLNGCDRPNLSRDTDWRKGFETLSEFGLHFEVTVYDHQLPEITELATQYPDQKIILCHLGTPVGGAGPYAGLGTTERDRTYIFKKWQDEINKLAECQNVFLKLSGLAMPVVGFGYEKRFETPKIEEIVEGFEPFLKAGIDAFGNNRCMFGSNFPIDKVSIPYDLLVKSYQSIFEGHGIENTDAIFHTTAESLYGLAL
ncbi:amidohydrolase family protein [Rhodohalobacter sulfatireducens]|uniref:Amidohydrolase family protein n=1 Tax=Rhodohalobacter sulfatireducens TaxID=2911366 RepID=A0ABS9KIP0_9BACT|nr:amidohydrolase family protein [Rhodohalobacter sulfatireducens]MCG2590719.1 amidohydrolase family protein [Rhodohalobacter sulfatireducens]